MTRIETVAELRQIVRGLEELTHARFRPGYPKAKAYLTVYVQAIRALLERLEHGKTD